MPVLRLPIASHTGCCLKYLALRMRCITFVSVDLVDHERSREDAAITFGLRDA